MNIRPYRFTDKRRVQEICLRTADDDYPFTTIEERPFRDYLLSTYCDYYIEREPENCFVLTDENDEAVGYILCAKEQKEYRRVFLKEYQPRVFCDRKAKIESWGEAWVHGLAARRYPAHLHIDILKGYRGGGNGTRMVETLCGHLKAQGVKGVHLIVGEENPNAIRFYERCGFDTQVKFTIGRIMGRKL